MHLGEVPRPRVKCVTETDTVRKPEICEQAGHRLSKYEERKWLRRLLRGIHHTDWDHEFEAADFVKVRICICRKRISGV
jgi:hypothetical protein